MTRRLTGAIVAVACVALLGGCASGAQVSDAGSSDGAQSAQADVSGAWGDDAYIDFADDGSFSGSSGCNLISGDWSANGSGAVFGTVATTERQCDGRSDWAATPSTAVVQDGEVVLLGSDGNTITVLAPRPGE